jgi:hypothetical protein
MRQELLLVLATLVKEIVDFTNSRISCLQCAFFSVFRLVSSIFALCAISIVLSAARHGQANSTIVFVLSSTRFRWSLYLEVLPGIRLRLVRVMTLFDLKLRYRVSRGFGRSSFILPCVECVRGSTRSQLFVPCAETKNCLTIDSVERMDAHTIA